MCNNFPNIRITEGNNFSIILPLRSRTYVATRPIDEEIDPQQLQNVVVTFGGVTYQVQLTERGVQIDLPATLVVGTYNILLTAEYLGSNIRAAYESAVTIVPWSEQSTAEQYIAGSPIVLRAAYVLGAPLTDAELEALKEEYREKNAQLQQAIADAEEAKREWEEKAADLDGVAKEVTAQAAKDAALALAPVAQAAEAYNTGKVELAENITAKGVPASASETLPELAGKVQAIQNINKEFNVSDISQGWLGIPGTLELIAQYYDAQYPCAQAYILAQGASVTAITGCKRIVYSDGGSVVSVDNPSGAYTIGAYSDEVTIGFAVLMFDTPIMQNVPVSNNSQVFEFGCKDATIEFGGMNSAYVRMCRFDGCDISMQVGALQSSRICIFDIGNSDITISGSNTFYNCTQLQSVSLPNVCTISGGSTFSYCTQLQSVSLPNVTTISGSGTFLSCPQLQSVSLPNVTTISGGGTFSNCTQLQSVSLPNVTTISGVNTFLSCANLIDIELGAAIEASFTLSSWNPTNVLADQTKKAQMLQNIREHIAANLPDRTGLSPLTITFSAAVKAAILADQPIADAFTNKNWIIA